MVHRVVGVKKGRLLLKADNGTQPDGWVDHQSILGRVVRVDHQGQPYPYGRMSQDEPTFSPMWGMITPYQPVQVWVAISVQNMKLGTQVPPYYQYE